MLERKQRVTGLACSLLFARSLNSILAPFILTNIFRSFLLYSGSTGAILYMVLLSNYYVISIKTVSQLRREADGDMNTGAIEEDVSACHPVKYLELFGHMIANMTTISSSLYFFVINNLALPVNGGQYCYMVDSSQRNYLPFIVIVSIFVASIVVNFIILLFHAKRKGESTAIGSPKKQQNRLSQHPQVTSLQGIIEKKENSNDSKDATNTDPSKSKSLTSMRVNFAPDPTKKEIAIQSFISRKIKERTLVEPQKKITQKSTLTSSLKSKPPARDPLAFDVRQMKKKIQLDSVVKSQQETDPGTSPPIYLGENDEEEGGGESSHSSSEQPFLLDPNELFVSKTPPRSRYGTDTDPYRFNVSRAKQDSSLSGIVNNHHTNDSVVVEDTEDDISDSSQALLFMGVFLFCYPTFCVLNIVYRATSITVPSCLVLFSTIVFSMQGILISLVCLRPTMILLKKENPDYSFGRIFFQAISQIGRIGKDVHKNHQRDARKGMFPIPNPMDLDDDKRSELNASITKEFRQYKKRMSAARYEIDIELLGNDYHREEETKKDVSP